MWVKVDDRFPDHRKVFAAGAHLGPYSTGRVLAIWLEAMCWTNHNGTDGMLPIDVVRTFKHDRAPLKVAQAMSSPVARLDGTMGPGLWVEVCGGYQVHDYDVHNDREKFEATSAARKTAGRHGGIKSGEARRQAKTKQVLQQNGSKAASTDVANTNPVPVPVQASSVKTTEEARRPDALAVMFERFAARFRERFGRSAHFTRGKDGRLLKNLVDQHGVDDVGRKIDALFQSRNDFVARSDYSVGVLAACYSRLTLEDRSADIEPRDIWSQIVGLIATLVQPGERACWLTPSRLIQESDEGVLTVSVPTENGVRWLQSEEMSAKVTRAMVSIGRSDSKVNYVVEDAVRVSA
jgi:hypothetical protein